MQKTVTDCKREKNDERRNISSGKVEKKVATILRLTVPKVLLLV
jgi:hypothetical protein